MTLSVVILGAGQGTRMHASLPKVLHLLGGKPLLQHVLDKADHLAPEQIIIVHGANKSLLQEKVSGKNIRWARQAEQKGTADAVASALGQIPDDHQVLILCGDVPLVEVDTLRRFVGSVSESMLGVLTAKVDNPKGLGRILRDENHEVVGIREEKDANDTEKQIHEVNSGIFLALAGHLKSWLPQLTNDNAQGEYYLTDILALAHAQNIPIATGHIDHPQEIAGINTRAQLALCERYYQRKQALGWLEKGASIADPNRIDVRGTLTLDRDVSIDIDTIFEGNVHLSEGAQIGAFCILKNCKIGPGVVIKPYSHLESVIVHEGAVIGPYARLRPGTEIHTKARVGNFVEIKNTTLGADSKANHLSYLGDAQIGSNVNIGAGTITCNYDGVEKHKTIIEDNVHIGSDTQLVAPIHVAKGATVGAGSTITKDVPSESLTLTHRLEQRTHDWARPQKKEKDIV